MSDFETFSNGDDESLMVNLASVEAQSFDPVPKGKYPIVVEEMEFQISKSSGKPMWSMRFSITDGEFANRKLFSYFSFSEKALPMTKANIAALDPELATSAFNPRTVADEGRLVGKTAIARVGIEKGEDGNDDRNTVKALIASGGDMAGDGFSM